MGQPNPARSVASSSDGGGRGAQEDTRAAADSSDVMSPGGAQLTEDEDGEEADRAQLGEEEVEEEDPFSDDDSALPSSDEDGEEEQRAAAAAAAKGNAERKTAKGTAEAVLREKLQRMKDMNKALLARVMMEATAAANTERAQRLKVSEPQQLTWANASKTSALEDWIEDMELMFDKLEAGEKARFKQGPLHIDRTLRSWWKGLCEQATTDGKPLTKWEEFADSLREHFLPLSEKEEAVSALIDLAQRQGESMDAYVLRAGQVARRAGSAFPDSATMKIMLERARKDEWPHTCAAALRGVRDGTIKTLTQLCTLLRKEALAEPGKIRNRSGGASSSAGSGGAQRPQNKARVSAAHTEGDSGSGGSAVSVAAASNGGDGRCYRCKETGHIARDCELPDTRKCNNCGEGGHLQRGCQKPKKGGADGKALPKNR